jgi:hypothetical protein
MQVWEAGITRWKLLHPTGGKDYASRATARQPMSRRQKPPGQSI